MNRASFAALALAAALIPPVAALAQGPAPAAARETLPDAVVPLRYDLALHPDIGKLTFSGEVKIEVEARSRVPAIVLNAKELVFDEARLEDGRAAQVSLDKGLERASLAFAGGVAAGRHTLTIRYHGAIGHSTLGFFAMDYVNAAGEPRRTLATNFEPADERRLMPSWDEPGRKARFRISVDAPADRMAISNMPVESETPLPGGLKRVRFAETPMMSTYLLFVGVGDYERISDTVDGTQVGVVVARGEAERGRYALKQATALLHYYNDYFGVRYPLPKLDLVAAPGEIEGGSMENWGAIFYSQEHLLFDPKASTEADRQLVFLVVSHEMAHQWFGDLVTMGWWDNLWLNEGFARWMQTKAADDLHPQWQTGLQSAAIVESGMRLDAKSSTHPVEQPVRTAAEAALAFDSITYNKGAGVIAMLERYVGPDRFREGVRAYMHAHAFGNTVSADLWRALQAAAADKPVQGVADDFTLRPGLPLVSVDQAAGGIAGLTQTRFLEAHAKGDPAPPDAPWRLPLPVRLGDGKDISLMLEGRHGEVSAAGPGPLMVNVGRSSYARVRYAPALFGRLASGFADLPAADQTSLILDGWALAQSQYAPVANEMDLIQATPADADPLVWARAVQVMAEIDRDYEGLPGRAAFRAWARTRLAPLAARIGWRERSGETPGAALLREPLLAALGRFGDEQVIAEARRIDADPGSEPAPVQRIAARVAAHSADTAGFERMVARLKATRDPLAKRHMLEDLATVEDPALAERVLDLIFSPEAPAGSLPGLLAEVAGEHPDLAWRYAVTHIDAPGVPVDLSTKNELMPALAGASGDLKRIDELKVYAASKLEAAAARPVATAAGQIRLNARMRTEGLPQVDAWLKGRGGR